LLVATRVLQHFGNVAAFDHRLRHPLIVIV
jgi:hypothetical protein